MSNGEPRLPLPLKRSLSDEADADAHARIWAAVQARRDIRGGHSQPPKAGGNLPLPLGRALTSSYPDELALERTRMWQSIQARRHAASEPFSWRMPALATGLAAAALLVAVVGVQQQQTAPTVALEVSEAVMVETVKPGPLLRADGTKLTEVRADQPARVDLADGSRITMQKGSALQPLLSTASRFEILLTEGVAEFDVVPNGPRRWIIQAGLATVEVVGTKFRVERAKDAVKVFVHHGIVLVRSKQLTNQVQRLTDGQALEVRRPAESAEAAEGTMVFELEPDLEPETASVARPKAGPVAAASELQKRRARWRAHAREGRYQAAFNALGRNGLKAEVRRAPTVERLLELADVARLSGHPRDAVAPLERILEKHSGSGHAALAAFTLGRLWLEQVKQPAKAAGAFERAIRMRPPHALLADCHARLVEAHSRAGDKQAAARAANRYRRLFPRGRHLSELDRWTDAQ